MVAPVLPAPVLLAPLLAKLVLFDGITGACNTLLVALVLPAPVLEAPVILALLEINTVHKKA